MNHFPIKNKITRNQPHISLAAAIGAVFTALSISSFTTKTQAQPAAVADRIVVVINNLPYSQLQVERYINVKEALRDDASKSQVVSSSNWNLALDEFTSQMAIHQEASKSSGFRPSKEAIGKLRLRCESAAKNAPQFKPAFDRLGLSNEELETQILKILTVENFRRGKTTLNKTESQKTSSTQSSWETELKEHSIVRYFEDAKVYSPLIFKP
jgi:hypothetical protein